MSTPASLTTLTGATRGAVVPAPRPRWKTRVLLPLILVGSVGGILAYAARGALWPKIDVWVVPAVVAPTGAAPRQAPAASAPAVIAQAPGWIEPDPYAVNVPALAPGVVKEVLVLEGDRVEAGQVVARLIDDDARLEASRSAAELEMRSAEVTRARAALDAANARTAEVKDEVERKRGLVEAGGFSEGQFARLDLRLKAMEREGAAARAALHAAEAAEREHRVKCEIADLALGRTEIRSPMSGVVVSRLVEPGSRVAMAPAPGENGAMAGAIVRLYDPSKLQVRADVPLADVAKIGVGTRAEVTTETLPGRTFSGSVSRVVHEADIQRNTVQVKVAIENPDPALKPEMLAKVRFFGAQGDGAVPVSGERESDGSPVLVPRDAIVSLEGHRAQAWVVDHSPSGDGPVAAVRDLEVAPGAEHGLVTILNGLRPGDRLIVQPAGALHAGSRVRVLGDRPPAAPQGGR